MTTNQSDEIRASANAVVETEGLIDRIIHDPFSSAIAATVSVALAVSLVLGGMGLISILIS
jgi:hypothetical protein